MELWNKWNKLSEGRRIAILLVFTCLHLLLVNWMLDDLAAREINFINYVQKHECVRAGFAGRRAEPFYKCDTGLLLEYEIRQKTR